MKTLVTGGGGFLAGHLIDRLLEKGHEVRTIDLTEAALDRAAGLGCETIAGDLRDTETVSRACDGIEVVFHVAALASPWGTRKAFWSINVEATDNIIRACREKGVRRMVHVSSPSAVFDGTDHYMADETLPYPKKFLSHYCETKAVSEQRVLEANGQGLETAALRPHVIWGPRDRNLVPRIAQRAKAGKIVQIGDGENEVSTIYVENGADALVLAADAPAAPGNVYFIAGEKPVKLWGFLRRTLEGLGLPGPRRQIPYPVAFAAGAAMEAAWRTFNLKGEPTLTRYTAAELAKSHSYSIARAQKDLGYQPRVSDEEGLARTLKYFNEKGIPDPP